MNASLVQEIEDVDLIGGLRPRQHIGEHVAGCLGRHVTPFHRRTLGEGGRGGGGWGWRRKAKGKCGEEVGRESKRERIGGRKGRKGRVDGRKECVIRAQNSFHLGLSICLNGQLHHSTHELTNKAQSWCVLNTVYVDI